MRIVSRTARNVREQEREESLRKREAAGTLATAFPRIEQVHFHFHFLSQQEPAPAARTHSLYSAAPAYFSFACPHGDCDGSIDLNAVTLSMLRSAGTQAHGTFHCPGTRTGGGGVRPACNQRVDYWIVARHHSMTRTAG